MLSIGTVYAEKNQGIGIRLNITPSDKSVQYGIITSDNKRDLFMVQDHAIMFFN